MSENLPTQEEIDLFADMFAPEDLHPDLVDYVVDRGDLGNVLHHPLVIQLFFNENLHRMANRQYAQKRERTRQALEEEDWTTFVYLHERPYRLSAFAHIASEIIDADEADYWELLADIWIDSESIGSDLQVWQMMLERGSAEERHQHFMTDEEREELELLRRRGSVTIYRGVNSENRHASMSWTLDMVTAQWFARRFRGHGSLLTATVDASQIIALCLRRNESEVIIDPDAISWTQSRVLPTKST